MNKIYILKPFINDVTIYLYYNFNIIELINLFKGNSGELHSVDSIIWSIADIKYGDKNQTILNLKYNDLVNKNTIYLNYQQKRYYEENGKLKLPIELQNYDVIKLLQSLKMTIYKTPNKDLNILKKNHSVDNTIYTNKHKRQLFVWKHFFYQSEGFENILNKMYKKLSISFRFAYIDDKFTSRLKNDTKPLIKKKFFEKKKDEKAVKRSLSSDIFTKLKKDFKPENRYTLKTYKDKINLVKEKLGKQIDKNIYDILQNQIKNIVDENNYILSKGKQNEILNEVQKTFTSIQSNNDKNSLKEKQKELETDISVSKEDQPSSSTTWQWTVKSDICSIIDDIKEKSDIKKPVAWKIDKNYLRVKDIKERMLRIPLLGNPTNCRLNPTHLDEKKIHTFCCLLMLSVSYSVPMIRAVNWEIVNKTWMMMLHQYKNIINEDGFWLVDIPEETKKKLDAIKKVQDESIDEDMEEEDLQVTFHGGRLLELVVRIYNLRITQDDDKGLKLFKPGVNNYRTYLEKYFEKMQPFMTPLEVKDGDTIADVIIKESWVHPKSLIDDVVEPFCKNMSDLLGFSDNPKIVYNDYFD